MLPLVTVPQQLHEAAVEDECCEADSRLHPVSACDKDQRLASLLGFRGSVLLIPGRAAAVTAVSTKSA